MAKYCSMCKNLDVEKVKEGRVTGSLYYCKKKEEYVNPSMCCCEDFLKNYGISRTEEEKIYNDGKEYYDDTTPLGLLVAIFIVMLVAGIFMGVF